MSLSNDTTDNMNDKQLLTVEAAQKGKNIFITGSAGTGKSHVIKYLHKIIEGSVLCSTTGIGATIIGGQTLHSVLKLGQGTATKEWYMSNSYTMKAIKSVSVLVVDEVSMLSGSLFNILNELAKVAKKSSEPFGGMQLILSGDFLQLPPIKSEFIFKTKAWEECSFETIELEEIMRQRDQVFIQHLQNIRIGNITPELVEYFNGRIVDEQTPEEIKKTSFVPTILFSHVKFVEEYNNMMLKQLRDREKKEFIRKVVKMDNCVVPVIHVPEKITLVEGAQVILTANVDVSIGLVNGARGVITKFESGFPIVKFISGVTKKITPYTWVCSKNTRTLYKYTQIPLLFGWAITIHKSQGMSLDLVAVDISACFDDGQAYVALSRARNIEGLFLLNVNWKKVRTNKSALKFYYGN